MKSRGPNPQKNTLLHSPKHSPQLPSIVSQATYNHNKIQKKQAEMKRLFAHQNLSFIEREAHRSSKNLSLQQNTLLNYYQMKEDRFQHTLQKNQWKNKLHNQLQSQRSTNTLLRQSSSARKKSAREELLHRNQSTYQKIKQSISSLEKELAAERLLEKQLLKKRNSAFSKAQQAGTQHAKMSSFYNNKCKSSFVKHELMNIHDTVREKQLSTTHFMSQKQEELQHLIGKQRKEHEQYYKAMQSARKMDFPDMYQNILDQGLLSLKKYPTEMKPKGKRHKGLNSSKKSM